MHGYFVLNFTRHAKGELHIYARGYQQAASALVEVFCAKPDYSDAESCPMRGQSRLSSGTQPSERCTRSKLEFVVRHKKGARILSPVKPAVDVSRRSVVWFPKDPKCR
jgi:hypothetical protein